MDENENPTIQPHETITDDFILDPTPIIGVTYEILTPTDVIHRQNIAPSPPSPLAVIPNAGIEQSAGQTLVTTGTNTPTFGGALGGNKIENFLSNILDNFLNQNNSEHSDDSNYLGGSLPCALTCASDSVNRFNVGKRL
jgi:hypothetical protein